MATAAKNSIERPQRWDVPFDEDMTDEMVKTILSVSPFKEIDQAKFPKSIPLDGVLLNEAKLQTYRNGDLVVRRGDYGNSAFFILKGSVRVVLPMPTNVLPEAVLGRKEKKKKTWGESIAQVWNNSKISEYRNKVQGKNTSSQGAVEETLSNDEESSSVREGEKGTQVFLQDIPGIIEKHKTVAISQGEFFGEIAALGRTPRTATIFANEDDTVLVEIKWQGLRDIRKYTPTIKEHIDRLYRKNSLTTQLGATPLFSHLSEADLQIVADATQFKSIGDFDWHGSYKKAAKKSAAERLDDETIIYEEGAYPESLLLIRAGFARVSVKNGNGHKTTSYLSKGQTFGLREIAHNWRSEESVTYQHTLRGLGYVDVLIIPVEIVEKYALTAMKSKELPPLFNLKEKSQQKPTEITAAKGKPTSSQDRISRTDLLEFMVENRYINGTASMLINLDRCTRCDDCVNACASAHDNNPRFVRTGKHLGNLMVAHSCMHCQDPVCMIGCPTGAIHRQTGEGQVTINDETCVGCATCANSCPYENIRMVEVRDENNDFIRDDNSKMPIIKATKCDLCAEQLGGPSCQNACPHDALVRMDMQTDESLLDWVRR